MLPQESLPFVPNIQIGPVILLSHSTTLFQPSTSPIPQHPLAHQGMGTSPSTRRRLQLLIRLRRRRGDCRLSQEPYGQRCCLAKTLTTISQSKGIKYLGNYLVLTAAPGILTTSIRISPWSGLGIQMRATNQGPSSSGSSLSQHVVDTQKMTTSSASSSTQLHQRSGR